MTPDELPAGEMKYSFKAHVQACGFAGDLIISSTSVNDLVKSLRLLEHAGIAPTHASTPTSAQAAAAAPVCQYHGPMKESTKRPGSFFCSAKMGDGSYCKAKA